jgi:hypothetical protein
MGVIARLLGLVIIVGSLASGAAEAQTPSIVYTRAVAEPAPFTFRLADVSAQWIALERDRDLSSQEILVLDARDGREVLRTPGMTLPAGGTRTVMENYDLAMSPRLSADRVITFLDPQTLAAISIPDGRELWRAPVSSIVLLEGALEVSDTRVAWSDASGLHVLDAASGRELWRAPLRPWPTGGHVALNDDGRVAAWDFDGTVIAWAANGVETARVTQPMDYGGAGILWSGGAIVTIGGSLQTFDANGGRVIATRACTDYCAAVDTGSHLVVLDAQGATAIARDGHVVSLRGVSASAWLHEATGHVVLVDSDGVATTIELTAGAVRSRVSVGPPVARHLYRPRPRVRVARGVSGVGDVLVRVDASGALEARSLATTVAPQPITIVGVLYANRRPRAGVRVIVGGVRVRTDARGRFRARVEVDGPILVGVPGEEIVRATRRPCASDVEQVIEVPPGGSRTARVRVDAASYGYECDRSCRCD